MKCYCCHEPRIPVNLERVEVEKEVYDVCIFCSLEVLHRILNLEKELVVQKYWYENELRQRDVASKGARRAGRGDGR